MPAQTGNDERRFGVTIDWPLLAAIGLGAALVLWTALFAAYRFDRADAGVVSSASVLLVVPPLVSYYLTMEVTQARLSLAARLAVVFGVAILWMLVQRKVIYPAFDFAPSVGESVANLILLPTFGVASWFAARSRLDRKRLRQALELQATTELRLLDAQLAPHILFNMLNAVYAVLLTDPQRAVPLFVAMSEALRHVVDRTRKQWIPVHEEVGFIRHYGTLEHARNPDGVTIRIDAEGDLDVPVPPMLLATLFENALKHGRLADGSLDVDVVVRIDEARIRFEVSNRLPSPALAAPGMGVGQSNLESRLNLLYADRARFRTRVEGGVYRATIEIDP